MVTLLGENPLGAAPLGENLQEAKGGAPGPFLDILLISYQVPRTSLLPNTLYSLRDTHL